MQVWLYICKTQIDVQSSNPCLISMSQIYVIFQILKSASNSQIYVLFQIFKFSNRHSILKSMAVSHFLKSTSNDIIDIYPNPNQ